jgi:hypothetical protein
MDVSHLEKRDTTLVGVGPWVSADLAKGVNKAAEARRRVGGCACASDPFGQRDVRCHDIDLLRSIVCLDQPHDLVVGRICGCLRRVSYLDDS